MGKDGPVGCSPVGSGHEAYHRGHAGKQEGSSPLPSESSKKSKAKAGQTVSFQSEFKEGPTLRAGPGALASEGGAGQACQEHSSSEACVAVATTCFHHKHLTTARRDVFLEETWQAESSLPAGQLVALPRIPTLHALPRAALEIETRHLQTAGGATTR